MSSGPSIWDLLASRTFKCPWTDTKEVHFSLDAERLALAAPDEEFVAALGSKKKQEEGGVIETKGNNDNEEQEEWELVCEEEEWELVQIRLKAQDRPCRLSREKPVAMTVSKRKQRQL